MSKTITKVIAGLGIAAGLGVAVLPLSSYALNQDVTVNFKVNPTLSGNETICSAADGGALAAGTVATVDCAINYSANGGASVSIKDKDANNSLVGKNVANTIAAFAADADLADLTPGTEGWGYKFTATTPGAAAGGLTAIAAAANYNGVPAAALTVGSNTAPVTDAAGTFTFGVQTEITTEADTYSDVVTISITPAA